MGMMGIYLSIQNLKDKVTTYIPFVNPTIAKIFIWCIIQSIKWSNKLIWIISIYIYFLLFNKYVPTYAFLLLDSYRITWACFDFKNVNGNQTKSVCVWNIAVTLWMQVGGWASVLCHTLLQVNLTQDRSSENALIAVCANCTLHWSIARENLKVHYKVL